VLEEARSIARESGVEVELVMRELSSAEALIAVADEHDARMIVVGSYGERPLKSALVGSTPTRLLHLSERPVLVVRAPE
jgi:nucleotide-binding universal stress UspA family protein